MIPLSMPILLKISLCMLNVVVSELNLLENIQCISFVGLFARKPLRLYRDL